jgi:hypothetical protein
VIAIVYGPRTDWLNNVLASGAAVIVREGVTHPVDQPEIVPMESARAYFPAVTQRIHRRIRVDRCLRVRLVKRRTRRSPGASGIRTDVTSLIAVGSRSGQEGGER